MNEIIALLALSMLVNIVLFVICRETLKSWDDLFSTCADQWREIIELRMKIKRMEEVKGD